MSNISNRAEPPNLARCAGFRKMHKNTEKNARQSRVLTGEHRCIKGCGGTAG